MASEIRISGIIEESIVDGPGIRYVVFAQGCSHNCPGCHNPETHSFNGGRIIEISTITDDIKKNPLLDGITLSGGEPFEQAEGFAELASDVKKAGMHVMTYTGFTYETILQNIDREGWKTLLSNTDLMVDGPFEIDKRSLMLKFRGSRNQRIIDVKSSLKQGAVVLAEI